jgi:hypothetical protein
MQHWNARFDEAKAIGMNFTNDVRVQECFLAVPEGVSKSYRKTRPDQSLREIGEERFVHPGWNRRVDLFDEAVAWLREEFQPRGNAILIASAGHSRSTDPVLRQTPHRTFQDRVFLVVPLSSVSDLAKSLRWARPASILAGLADEADSDAELSRISLKNFICDAYRGDSLSLTRA